MDAYKRRLLDRWRNCRDAGMYGVGKYDLAGFAVGEVYKKDVIDGSRVQNGDAIVGIASSGIHSNGLSLARLLGREEMMKNIVIGTSGIITIYRNTTVL